MPFLSAVITAGGSSSRFGSDKLRVKIGGTECLALSVLAFERAETVNEIVVVCNDGNFVLSLAEKYGIKKLSRVVPGGETRQHSVRNGFLAVSPKADFVAVHDGARPLITPSDIDGAARECFLCGAVCVCAEMKDTPKISDENGFISSHPSRKNFYSAQTPQIFSREIYEKALSLFGDRLSDFTDDSSLCAASGAKVKIYVPKSENIKLTTPADYFAAQKIFESRKD